MTEQTKKVTRGQNTLSILLLLTDAVQVAGILTSPELGWSFDFLSWTSVLSVTRLLRIMVVGWAVAFTVWALSLAVMSLALANTGLVVWRVAIGVTGSVWPLRTLRAFVTVALTALYIPLLESASVFMSCDAMVQAYKEEAPECWGASHGALFAVSLVVVLLFVPFALVMQAVYFDDAPTSGNVEAKALARAELLDTMARTLLVYISLFASEQSRLGLTAITAVAYTGLFLLSVRQMPYYILWMTQVRLGKAAISAWLALGGFALAVMRDNSVSEVDVKEVARAWLLGSFGAFAVGWICGWARDRGMRLAAEDATLVALRRQHRHHEQEARRNRARYGAMMEQVGRLPQPKVVIGVETLGGSQRPDQGTVIIPEGAMRPRCKPGAAGAAASASVQQPDDGDVDSGMGSGGGVARPRLDITRPIPEHREDGATSHESEGSAGLQVVSTDAKAIDEEGRAEHRQARAAADATRRERTGPPEAAGASSRQPPGHRKLKSLDSRAGSHQAHEVPVLSRQAESDRAVGHREGRPASDQEAARVTHGATFPHRSDSVADPFTSTGISSAAGRASRDEQSPQVGVHHGIGLPRHANMSSDVQLRARQRGSAVPVEAPKPAAAEGKAVPNTSKQQFLEAVRSSLVPQHSGTRGAGSGEVSGSCASDGASDTGSAVTEGERICMDAVVAASSGELLHALQARMDEERRGIGWALWSLCCCHRDARRARHHAHHSHHSSGHDTSSAGGGAGGGGRGGGTSSRVGATPSALHGAAHRAARPGSVLPSGLDLDRPLRPPPAHGSLSEHAHSFFSAETDVELMVRALLRRPRPRDILVARALLDEALRVYPESVFVRLTYATFLLNWATDGQTLFAITLLADAARLPAPFDLRYVTYAKITKVLDLRRLAQMGRKGAVDSIELIEFRKELRDAETLHAQAVRHLAAWWRALGDKTTDGVNMRGSTVSDRVQSIARISDRAERKYLRLLERHPQARTVARAYGIFLINVRCDVLGAAYVRVSEDVDDNGEDRAGGRVAGSVASGSTMSMNMIAAAEAEMERSSDNGGGAGSVGSSSNLTSSDIVRRRQRALNAREVHRTDLPVVKRTTVGFQLALLALVAAVGVLFVSKWVVFSTLRLSVETMDAAGLRRKLTESSWYAARGMQLMALNGDLAGYTALRKHLLTEMNTLGLKHTFLYYHGKRFPEIDKLWGGDNAVTFRLYNKDLGKLYNQSLTLWDAGNMFVATASRMARLNMSVLAAAASTNPEWRFVIDNAPNAMLNAFELAVRVYEAEDEGTVILQSLIDSVVLGLKLITLLVLGWCVFLPALRSIQRGKADLQVLVRSLPQHFSRHMARRFRHVEKAFGELEQGMTSLDDVDPTSAVYNFLKDVTFLKGIPPESKRHKRRIKVSARDDDEHLVAPTRTGPKASPAAAAKPKRSAVAGRQGAARQESAATPASGHRHGDAGDAGAAEQTAAVGVAAYAAAQGLGADGGYGAPTAPRRGSGVDLVTEADLLEGVHDAEELASLMQQRHEAVTLGMDVEDALKVRLSAGGMSLVARHDDAECDELEEPPGDSPAPASPSSDTEQGERPSAAQEVSGPSDGGSSPQQRASPRSGGATPDAGDVSATALAAEPGSGTDASSDQGFKTPQTEAGPTVSSQLARPAPSAGARGPEPLQGASPAASSGGAVVAEAAAAPTPLLADASRVSGQLALASPASPGRSKLARGLRADGKERPASPSSLSAADDGSDEGSAAQGMSSSRRSRSRLATRHPEVMRLPPASAIAQGTVRFREGVKSGSRFRPCNWLCCSGGRASEGHKLDKSLGVWRDKQLRGLTLRVLGVLSLLVIGQVVEFWLTLHIVNSGSTKPAELNNAGRRRYLARETLNTAREMLINDGEVASLPELAQRLDWNINFYRKVHNGLRRGDEDLGLPGASRRYQALEDLMYGRQESGFEAADIVSLQVPGVTVPSDALAAYGLDPLFRLYTSTMEELHQEFSNSSRPRPGLSQGQLLALPKFSLAFELERGAIGSGMGAAVKIHKSEGLAEMSVLETTQNLLLSLELVFVLMVYAAVHRLIRRTLQTEHRRALDVQQLVPGAIAKRESGFSAWRLAVKRHLTSVGGPDAVGRSRS
ncbi:hypothetical protein FNF28_00794 [Cafeteria roenbergensis]|nr:hypothetical protein FNF28_00794 [Cafeteria roenbergensis]